MDKLLALFAFIAALGGCNPGRNVVEHRVSDRGIDRLRSRVTVEDGVARLDCVASVSGTCHYLLLPRECATADDCRGHARRIDVARGDVRQLAGVNALRLCVSDDARNVAGTCATSTPIGN